MIDLRLGETLRQDILISLPNAGNCLLNFDLIPITDVDKQALNQMLESMNVIYQTESKRSVLLIKQSEIPVYEAGLLLDNFDDCMISDIPDVEFEDLEFYQQLRLFSEYISSLTNRHIGVFIPDMVGFINLVTSIIRRKSADNQIYNEQLYYFVIAISRY